MARHRHSPRNEKQKRGARRPPRELARTWLITVINPALQGLRREQSWLLARNWSWRYSTGTLEFLWPVESYIDPLYRDNFAEFLVWYPNAREVIRLHDAALHNLVAACNMVFRRLWAVGDLASAVMEADAMATRKGIIVEQARGAVPAEQWPRLLAEYLINNVRVLPEHYTTASYWREAGPIILKVRDAPSLREDFEKLDRAGETTATAVQDVETVLLSIRRHYTKSFGFPPVPLPSRVDTSEI
jgi:hypothetical protein